MIFRVVLSIHINFILIEYLIDSEFPLYRVPMSILRNQPNRVPYIPQNLYDLDTLPHKYKIDHKGTLYLLRIHTIQVLYMLSEIHRIGYPIWLIQSAHYSLLLWLMQNNLPSLFLFRKSRPILPTTGFYRIRGFNSNELKFC